MPALLQTLRGVGVLGDQNIATVESVSRPAVNGEADIFGPLDDLADQPQSVDHVVFRIYVYGVVPPILTRAYRLSWYSPTGVDFVDFDNPGWLMVTKTQRPGGGAWTKADLDGTNLNAAVFWEYGGEPHDITLSVGEFECEVWGTSVAPAAVVHGVNMGPSPLNAEVPAGEGGASFGPVGGVAALPVDVLGGVGLEVLDAASVPGSMVAGAVLEQVSGAAGMPGGESSVSLGPPAGVADIPGEVAGGLSLGPRNADAEMKSDR